MTRGSVSLLGTGKMGAALVDRWVDAGRPVVVWNRTTATAAALVRPGVTLAPSSTEAASSSDVVVTMFTDGPALRSVLIAAGTITAMRPGTVLIDLSTVDIASSAAVATEAAAHGVLYVRGAVSGTPPVVRLGTCTLLLSAPQEALDAAHEALLEVTPTITVLGASEEARIVKIAINGMLAGTMELLAEATLLAESAGVRRETFLDALDASVLGSRFISYKGAALRAREYSPTFTTRDMVKDVSLATGLAEANGVRVPVSDLVKQLLQTAIDNGYSARDFLSLFAMLQAASGVAPDEVGTNSP